MRLIDLYRPLCEVSGRNLSLHDFPDDVQVAWDDFSQRQGITTASFIERSGRIYANTKGHGWFEWDGVTWRRAEKPGPKTGPETGQRKAYDWRNDGPTGPSVSLHDVFSTDFVGYRNNVSQAAAKLFGKNWTGVIEQVYGKGAVDRIFSALWRNFWTDYEALGEVSHYYDAARQALNGDGTTNYNLNIGPRYDIPGDFDGTAWDDDSNIRRQRVTDPSYFQAVYSSS